MDAWTDALLDPTRPPPSGLKTWNGSDPLVRFNVYRNNVVVSLCEALADTFPVTQAILGQETFWAVARAYLDAGNLPDSPQLVRYGATFPAFLATLPFVDRFPYLPDLSALEYAYVQAFHAADAAVLDPTVLQHALTQPEQLPNVRFVFHPSVAVIASRHPIATLWHAYHETADAIAFSQTAASIEPRAEPTWVVRSEETVYVIPVTPADARCLAALHHGEPLGTAVERAAADEASAYDPAALFALLLRHGALTQLILLETPGSNPTTGEMP
ncbi:MAG TPA: DUF2063 domain-containing protein [Rhodocyclaceae bacterium]|nr:DUF2063 domain-containing protein [Rhodocyclaceae bacterium]